MVDEYYKKFKVKDYMGEEENSNRSKVIDCSLGTNPFISKKRIKKYAKKASFATNEYVLNVYDLLKHEILKMYKEVLNKDINEQNISFGSGTMGIIRNLSEFLIHKDTKVLGIAPQFTRFISEVKLKKGIYNYYSLEQKNNYKFVTKDFVNKINEEYDLIYIDNPNNPTGQIIPLEDIEQIVQVANKYGIITIIDEAYGDYMKMKNSSISLVEKYENIVVLRSASKFFGLPNHRIGYMFASKELIKIYDEISIPFPFSDLSANVFVNTIRDYKNIEKTKIKVIEANKKIYSNLEKDNYLYTSIETPIFTLKTDKEVNLKKELLNNNVLVEDGNNFINLNEKYARIRINKEYEKLIKILKNI